MGSSRGVALTARPRKERTVSAMDKVKNIVQTSKGRMKKTTGKATDDRSLEAKGKGDQVSGNLKQAGENVKDAFKK